VTSRSVAEVAHFFPTGVTSAIRMRYRGRSFSSSRSHLIVPSAIENACRVGVCGTMDMSLCHPLNLACPQADSLGYNTTFSSMLVWLGRSFTISVFCFSDVTNFTFIYYIL